MTNICENCIHKLVCLYLNSWEFLESLKKISDFDEKMEEIDLCFYYYQVQSSDKTGEEA